MVCVYADWSLPYVLVRNWEFFFPTTAATTSGEVDPLKLLRRKDSLVIADLPVSPVLAQMPHEMKSGGHMHKPPPTVFEEPDSNSLLDSFGF